MSAPVPIEIPPGVVKSQTSSAAKGRWVATEKARFVSGKAEKWGGWELYVDEQMDGLMRGMFAWTTDANISLLAGGTFRKFYSVLSDLQDITPLRESGTLGANPFATTNGSATVTVTDVAHGLDPGAKVHYTGASAFAGITILGEYEVVTVPTANTYTIVHTSNANASTSGGGAAVAYEYEINPGELDTTYGLGFGAGPYGEEEYGTERSESTLALEMRFWSIDTYGTLLLINPSGGTIYLWDQPAADDRAEALSGAPASVRYTFVTAERFIFALGTTTPMTVEWPDQDVPTNWTPATGNTANTRNLKDGNKLIAGVVFNDAVNIIWSDNAIYQGQYLAGNPFVYDIAVIKTSAGLVGPAAFCVTPVGVLWLSGSDLYLYNGAVQQAQNFNDVRDWFFGMYRRDKAHKTVMIYNALKNEVQLQYASAGGSGENDAYIAVSLDDWSWTVGTMAGDDGHTAMCVRRIPTKNIFAAHADGYIYEHELGVDADGAAMESYIESGLVGLADGGYDIDVIGYQPDFYRQEGAITLDVSVYDRPRQEQLGNPVDSGSYEIGETDDLVDMLLGGRFAKHRLTSNVIGGDWRLGLPTFEVGKAGDSR